MPYDAFGNKVGDDPLAGLGSSGREVPGVPDGEPPRRWPLVVAAAIVLLIVAGTIGGAAVLLSGGGADDDPPTAATPERPAAEAPADPDPEPDPAPAQPATPVEPEPEEPTAAEPAEPPTGLRPGSLLRRANFTVALRRLRAEAKGEPRNLRVEAERIDVQVVLRDGRLRNAQARWDGEVRVISTTSTPIGGLETFPWSVIDRGAPQRIVRSASGRARKPASAFNYAVLLEIEGMQWSAFLKSGAAFIASPSGRIERQVSG